VASLGDSLERRVEFVSRLEALGGPVAGALVLDLGCGRQALWTRAYLARGARVVALERDAGRCREAAGRLLPLGGAPPGRCLGVVRADGERLPLPAGSVSFVHCAQVLEHVTSPRALLHELRRVLAPGGFCYLTAINRHTLRDPHFGVPGVTWLPRRLADRLLGWMGAVNPEGQPLSAMHYFSRREFERLCRESGLDLVADLKREERLARRGAIAGRLADLWDGAFRTKAFHLLVCRRDPPGIYRASARATARLSGASGARRRSSAAM
jgi:ubiquinone/menaquinone biosynthesis C-methylase UbiE